MAILFELLAEFGSNAPAAHSFWDSFRNVRWTLSNDVVIEPDLALSDVRECKGVWWCSIFPRGVSYTGSEPLIKSAEPRIELTKQMYATLKARSGFRFALIGWELSGRFDFEEIRRADFRPEGLVVSATIHRDLQRPELFEPFGPETLWRRPTEAGYHQIARLFE